MKIKVGDVIKTPHRRLTVVVKYMDRGTGKEKYRYESIIHLCTNRTRSLKKVTEQLDMSVLEEL